MGPVSGKRRPLFSSVEVFAPLAAVTKPGGGLVAKRRPVHALTVPPDHSDG